MKGQSVGKSMPDEFEALKQKNKKTMLDKYLKQLEEMSDRKAEFTDYYNNLREGLDKLEGNNKSLFIYAVLNAVRDLGYENGKRATKEAMTNFLNCN